LSKSRHDGLPSLPVEDGKPGRLAHDLAVVVPKISDAGLTEESVHVPPAK
jgi:hypothetical protein